ncbi:hypothetical protein D5018_04660 [Parashewanella curva]|uniref:ABC-type zinc uptake system zinc chaperone n=1 Tax=Parashewanella curva TaxID=2338552 RepID=A0A3L8PZU7_9GAMM|nr:hypothetical protein [Parashewanella curva]RLV60937.1 hypothetical protein D5018_04660 [Parashewanella curva]
MNTHQGLQHKWIIWLCAVLLLLSAIGSAHVHAQNYPDNDGLTEHCTLCFHHHQLQHTISSAVPSVGVSLQTYIELEQVLVVHSAEFVSFFSARAPPF